VLHYTWFDVRLRLCPEFFFVKVYFYDMLTLVNNIDWSRDCFFTKPVLLHTIFIPTNILQHHDKNIRKQDYCSHIWDICIFTLILGSDTTIIKDRTCTRFPSLRENKLIFQLLEMYLNFTISGNFLEKYTWNKKVRE